MRHSTERILVSHTGNLPRPAELNALIDARNELPSVSPRMRDLDAFHQRLPRAVDEVVDRQIELGVDVVNDGEYVKAGSYGGYIQSRLSGFESRPFDAVRGPKRAPPSGRDALQFPGFYASGLWYAGGGGPVRPGFMTPGPPPVPTHERVCTGPVRYTGQAAIRTDTANLAVAIEGRDVEGFIAALGPLSVGAGLRNEYYADEETYLFAVAEAVREEYLAITDAGLILQVDEPEFATSWQFHPEWTLPELRTYLALAVRVINHALAGVPEDQVRFHFCWASPHRPHVNDIPFAQIIDLLVQIDAQAYSFEAANVRHAHEWKVWRDVRLPPGKILVPGVVTHATDLVEHPRLVADRLITFADLVGRENVQTGTDCGIGSRVGHEEVAWAKLAAMAAGARLASAELWA